MTASSSSPWDFGGYERRTFTNSYAKPSGPAGGSSLKVVGHAAVFGSPSCEMRSPYGNFIEYVAPGAFDAVLRSNPDVVLTFNHDPNLVLARTGAGLELRTDARGLRYFAEMANTSTARDLQALMAQGVVNQSSFLFRVSPQGEDWSVSEDGLVTRTIRQVGELVDVCVATAGAYPDTDSALARTAIHYAAARGFIQDPALELRRRKALALSHS